jgi:hypothetical protein
VAQAAFVVSVAIVGGFESSRVTVTHVTDIDPGRRRALLTVGGSTIITALGKVMSNYFK